jgi:hypothetical protein
MYYFPVSLMPKSDFVMCWVSECGSRHRVSGVKPKKGAFEKSLDQLCGAAGTEPGSPSNENGNLPNHTPGLSIGRCDVFACLLELVFGRTRGSKEASPLPHYRLWLAKPTRLGTWLRVGMYYRARTDGLSAGIGCHFFLRYQDHPDVSPAGGVHRGFLWIEDHT